MATLDVLPPMIRTARWRSDRMAEAAIADFSLATDAADLLARRGIPFREAHEATGKLVAYCIAQGKTFADLTDARVGRRAPHLCRRAAAAHRRREHPRATSRVAPPRIAYRDQLAAARSALLKHELVSPGARPSDRR